MLLKNFSLPVLMVAVSGMVFSQDNSSTSDLISHYYRLERAGDNPQTYRISILSDIDSTWNNWKLRGYRFGFDPSVTPMYSSVEGILSTPYMIQVRGNADERNKKRWGYHVFEGYAKDDMSRITMLVNKHTEEGKPVAEMYYYGTVYNHSETAYNWVRIGSDVRQHSFLFSRDKAIFYGSLRLNNALTLGRIGKATIRAEAPEGDDETNSEESAKYVNYRELKESGNGTIFYDQDNHIVVIKVDGRWMKLNVEPLPEGVDYEFD